MRRRRSRVRGVDLSSPRSELRLDWCSYAAAKYAVEHWHYSRSMPAGKLVSVGAWERGGYMGAVIFGRGANRNAGSPYGLTCTEIAELVRVALRAHTAPVSRVVMIAVRMLRAQSPGLRLLFSYADPVVGHHGGIYQASGWMYVGHSSPQADVHGVHKRSLSSRARSIAGSAWTKTTPKHKYLLPLDADMRVRILPLAQPYPKRAGSIATDALAHQAGEGGVTPTPALQVS